ncbi:c-type cytochrome [Paraburkholderia caribensis]|uniref:c-type cytochrome n=1 Tax=Paraburkholderia caribensis TaxID=75105 RepID=UPI001CAE1A3E|nr:c-type cytochrome [Paraburkholderia caribensis]CAG9269697.1 Putative diheme cytochrome c-553 [Paraburkholderia caribensis]
MKKPFRWLAAAAFAGLMLAGGYMTAILLLPKGEDAVAPVSGAPAELDNQLARGEYLARAADCVACHTAAGGRLLAGGLAFKLPFGTIFSTNITPDRETGIGAWTDEEFVRAVRQGISPHGHLYPAMPYTSYTQLSRDDVLAIKAYLFSQEPVRQPNAPNGLSFPFNQRWGMAFWNLAFFRDHRMPVSETKSVEWNRGAYLALALGHCAECHTPRNFGYGLKDAQTLSGGNIQGWFAGNITPDPDAGIGRWTDEQLMNYLSTGHASGRSSASGPMAEVMENSLQYLSRGDIKALAVYLRDVPPVAADTGATVNLKPKAALASSSILPADSTMIERDLGARLFASDCAGCHQWNGNGRQLPYASLLGSTAVNDPQGRNVVQVILKGSQLTLGGQAERMPGFGGRYSDADVAALANFVVRQFGGKDGVVTAKQALRQRQE